MSKDVQLIIRAKNEATKTLDSVSKALKELDVSQDKVGKSAGKTDSALGSLAQEFQKLNSQVAALGAIAKVSSQIDNVAKSVKGLEGTARAAAQDFANLARQTEEAAKATRRLKAETDAAKASLEAQKAATAAGRTEQTRANKELKDAERIQRDVNREAKKHRSATPFSNAATSAQVFAAADVEAARRGAEVASASYKKLRAEQAATTTTIKGLSAALKQTEAVEKGLTAETERLANSTKESARALQQGRSELTSMRTAAEAAGKAIGQTSLDQDKLASSTQRVAAELARTKEVFNALSRFSTGGAGFTDSGTAQALQRQRAQVNETKQAWATLQEEARRLGATMRETNAPTAAQTEAFARVTAAARAAKAEFTQQQAALAKLQGSARSTFAEFSRGIDGTRRLSVEQERLASAATRAGSGLRQMGAGAQQFEAQGRKALSMVQRLRAEVLGLGLAYVGLYGSIRNIGGVITAYQSLESAQNRLGAALRQDTQAVASEMRFLEAQAARLGIRFSELAENYGKFSVASKSANFTTAATREIFLAVAEAGRVNKLSMEQMNGVFLALEQMISKGKVSMEELRRQLGDRLPGAFNIMARALGVTTAELDKMVSSGQVFSTQDVMLRFAREMTSTFGGQLPEALKTTTTLLGQFSNELFQAQLRVGEGGFIEALNVALRNLNEWFRSREGRDFFLSLGNALGIFVGYLAEVPQYFDLILLFVKAFVAIKLGQWFASLYANIMNVSAAARAQVAALTLVEGKTISYAQATQRLTAVLGTTRASLQALSATLATSRAAAIGFFSTLTVGNAGLAAARVGTVAWTATLGLLRGAMVAATAVARAFWVAVGGPIGIIIAGLGLIATELMSRWAGGVNEVTSAMDEHRRIVGEVGVAYAAVKGTTEEWANVVKNVTLDQANANVRNLREQFKKLVDDIASASALTMGEKFMGATAERRMLKVWSDRLSEGRISAEEFLTSLQALYAQTRDDGVRKLAEDLLAKARAAEQAQRALGEGAVIAREMGSTLDGLGEDIRKTNASFEALVEVVGETEDAFDDGSKAVEAYGEAIDELKKKIPALARELTKLKNIDEIEAAYRTATENATSQQQIFEADYLRQRALASVDIESARRGPKGDELKAITIEATRLAEKLGVSARDLLTVFSYETGGTLNPNQKGPTTKWGTHRGLIQFGEYQANKFGYKPGESSIEQQFEAIGRYLEDAGVKAGDSLLRIYAAVNAGDPNKTGARDAAAGGAPGTVADKVNNQMGGHLARADALLDIFDNDILAAEKERTKEIERQAAQRQKEAEREAEALQKRMEGSDQTIRDLEFQFGKQEMINAGREREAEIEEAIRNARKANADLTDEQADKIAEITGKLWDQRNALKEIEDAEKEIARLREYQRELLELIKFETENGNTSKAEELRGILQLVNGELQGAIERTIAMYQAMGGPEADLAIAKLQNVANATKNIGASAVFSTDKINDMLAGGMTNAFDEFAQAVARGENAIEALGRAFQKFAAEFLIEIGKMILKQALLNSLKAVSAALSGGLTSILGFHTGGVVGTAHGMSFQASPAIFAGATRYHGGGIAGLRPDEVPAILKVGEEVLTEDDARHRKNGGLGGGSPTIKVVNTFDSGDVVSEGLNSAVGEETLLNVVRSNAGSIRAILGS